MASIEVDAAALSTLAHRCDQQASRLERMTVPPTHGDTGCSPRLWRSAPHMPISPQHVLASRRECMTPRQLCPLLLLDMPLPRTRPRTRSAPWLPDGGLDDGSNRYRALAFDRSKRGARPTSRALSCTGRGQPTLGNRRSRWFIVKLSRRAGTTWLGIAADAAAFRTGTDQAVVNRAADALQEAAGVARRGVDDIIAARQLVFRAIDVLARRVSQ